MASSELYSPVSDCWSAFPVSGLVSLWQVQNTEKTTTAQDTSAETPEDARLADWSCPCLTSPWQFCCLPNHQKVHTKTTPETYQTSTFRWNACQCWTGDAHDPRLHPGDLAHLWTNPAASACTDRNSFWSGRINIGDCQNPPHQSSGTQLSSRDLLEGSRQTGCWVFLCQAPILVDPMSGVHTTAMEGCTFNLH